MTAEQWLDDMEAKADAALEAVTSRECYMAGDAFLAVARPASVKRLVAVVRVLADKAGDMYPCPYETCKKDTVDCAKCCLEEAYQQVWSLRG